MSKSIVWIISHGGISKVKTFHRQLSTLTIFDSVYIYVKCLGQGENLSFVLSVMHNINIEIKSPEQLMLESYIEQCSKELGFEQFIARVSEIKALSFVNPNISNVFIDANLGEPNLKNITHKFHLIVQEIGKYSGCFYKYCCVYKPVIDLHVYPFSQNELCCEEANSYIRGDVTPSYELNSLIYSGFCTTIPLKGIAADLLELAEILQRKEPSFKKSFSCYDFFGNRYKAPNHQSVIPLSGQDTELDRSDLSARIMSSGAKSAESQFAKLYK
jgi:hypothetical protein